MMPLWMSTLGKHFTDAHGLVGLIIPTGSGMIMSHFRPQYITAISKWIKKFVEKRRPIAVSSEVVVGGDDCDLCICALCELLHFLVDHMAYCTVWMCVAMAWVDVKAQ
ncbi:hypothetical protein NECAME_15595 [Necator americanus]|uniref:Uncharacterized protein n=1 Tax=Necator americanus TaxID=51031 RepID=W2SGS1_NECAM|nr:hypothetical protein NECAME_15595 [Necator americanus]ETN68824.1 hypothetical protein NECAME_15595 [Necator americanus]